MHDSENDTSCPNPEMAAVFGGCPGRDGVGFHIRDGFGCANSQNCPVIARMWGMRQRIQFNAANDNDRLTAEIIDLDAYRAKHP